MSEGACWKASRCLHPAPAAEMGWGQPRPGHFVPTRAMHGENAGMGKVREVMLSQMSYMDMAWLLQLLFLGAVVCF